MQTEPRVCESGSTLIKRGNVICINDYDQRVVFCVVYLFCTCVSGVVVCIGNALLDKLGWLT